MVLPTRAPGGYEDHIGSFCQLVPKLHLGTKIEAKLSLAEIETFPSSAWEREKQAINQAGPLLALPG